MSTAELSPRRRRRRFLVGYEEQELSVKREPEEDIKDYAETTMNELLGWYGYEKVDSRDTQGLNLTHFASNNPSGGGGGGKSQHPPNGASPPSSAVEGSDNSEDAVSHHEQLEGPPSRVRSESESPGPDVSSTASDEVARQHQQMVSALSSITKHPGAPDSPNLPPGCIVCAWCQKVGMKLFTLKTPNGCKAFCSELCFTQCRRASFKKNKICDWCKHVRHTVNYVDFQDGEQQLQFCSDKCLNQYKMNIFCKETQAHLQMHTHLKEAACKMKVAGSMNLITPELWLRDCKTNGNSTSPLEGSDVIEDANSDENLSAIPSPTYGVESSRPVSPALKDLKEQRHDLAPVSKEKEKQPRRSSSKHSPKKSGIDKFIHLSSRHHREKKANNSQHSAEPSRHSPIQALPSSHHRNGQMSNGNGTLLSPPPLGIPRAPHPVGSLPPRHYPPPVPSPIGMEPSRQPFMHPGMVPPPFQFFAQQQMEAFLRSQHDLRSKAPPHLPIPPWIMPPFPAAHPSSQPPLHQPISSSRSPSLQHSSPPSRSLHVNSNQKSHHGRHKHNRHSSGHSSSSSHSAGNNIPHSDVSVPFPSSLIPPVTVMVPFPLVLPVPLPIPVPVPIPPDVMEKYKIMKLSDKLQEEKENDTLCVSDSIMRKRKLSHDSKHKMKRRYSNASYVSSHIFAQETTNIPTSTLHAEKCYDQVQNLSFKASEGRSNEFCDSSKVLKCASDVDLESRSYSPFSEVISSNEDEETAKQLKNGDINSYPAVSFSHCSLNMSRSSPIVENNAQENDPYVGTSSLEFSKSPSPTNLSVRERQQNSVSSTVVNFKKKHLREQLSLMT